MDICRSFSRLAQIGKSLSLSRGKSLLWDLISQGADGLALIRGLGRSIFSR